jgi:outer membrane protein TolC
MLNKFKAKLSILILASAMSLPVLAADDSSDSPDPTPLGSTLKDLEITKKELNAMGNADNLLPSNAPSKKLSMSESIALALRYNSSVQIAEIDRITQKFNLYQAANEFEIQYALTASYNAQQARVNNLSIPTYGSTVTPVASLNNHYGGNYTVQMNNPTSNGLYNPGLNLTVTQPLLRGFGKDVTTATYYNAIDQEEANKLLLKSTLISNVSTIIQDYRTIVTNQYNVETNKLGLDNYSDTLKSVKALIVAGRKAPSDIVQAESDYTTQEVNVEQAENSVITSKLTLVSSIGLPPQINFTVPNDVEDIKPVKLDAQLLFNIALENNPTYLTQKLVVRQNERNLLVARDNMRTQLDATINANTGNGSGGRANAGLPSLSNNRNTLLAVGFQLTVPINDFALKSALISAQTTLSESKVALTAAKFQLMNNIINDITNVQSNYKQVVLAINSVNLAQKNQDILNAQYKLGLKSTFEVNEQLKNLLSDRSQLINAKITYLNSLTQLYSDMGILLEKYNIKVRY